MATLWVLLGVVPTEDLELEQLDVKTAFRHGDLDEDIYMSQPTGFTATREQRSPCLQVEEEPIWPKTSAANVVPEI